jgi:hypothetical protein
MFNQLLVEGIKKHVLQGDSKEQIRAIALQSNYGEREFDIAYNVACAQIESSAELSAGSTAEQGHEEIAHQESNAVASVANPSVSKSTLPTIFSLIQNSILFLIRRKDLVFFGTVVQLISSLMIYIAIDVFFPFWMVLSALSYWLLGVVALIFFILWAFISYINIGALLYASITPFHTPYKEALIWAYRNFWALVYVYLLYTFIVCGGFLLLIVPGLYFLIVFGLVPAVFVNENLRGVSTLMRSRQLVKDNQMGVFLRLCAIVGITIPISLLATGVSFFAPNLSHVINGLVNVPLVLFIFYGIGQIYKSLALSADEFQPAPKTQYIAFFVLGLLGVLVVPVIMTIVMSSLDAARNVGNDTATVKTLNAILSDAEMYAVGNESESVKGFCNEYFTYINDNALNLPDVFVCNDTNDGFAASAQLSDGQHYCVELGQVESDSLGTYMSQSLKDGQTVCKTESATSLGKERVVSQTEPTIETADSEKVNDSDDNWFTLVTPQKDMQLSFPGKPQLITDEEFYEVSSPDDPTTDYVYMYESNSSDVGLALYKHDYSVLAERAGGLEASALLKGMLAVELSPYLQNELLYSNIVRHAGLEGFTYQIRDEYQRIHTVLMLIDGVKVYQLSYFGDKNQTRDALVTRYFDSFIKIR